MAERAPDPRRPAANAGGDPSGGAAQNGGQGVGLLSNLWCAARSLAESFGLASPSETDASAADASRHRRGSWTGSARSPSRGSSVRASTASFGSSVSIAPRSTVAVLGPSEYEVALDEASRPHTAAGDRVVTQEIIQIHGTIPARFRLTPTWRLIYSTVEHGFSLATLYARCKTHNGALLLAVRDDGGAVFGVFSTDTWAPHLGPYGSGETFLWRAVDGPDVLRTLPPAAAASAEALPAAAARIVRWGPTGANAQFMVAEAGFLASGCSDGRFGLWIDEQLLRGQSEPTATFANACIASQPSFTCGQVELWGIERPDSDLL